MRFQLVSDSCSYSTTSEFPLSNYESRFLFAQSLRPALLNVREMCYRISDMGLCKVEKGRTYTLDEFRDTQFRQLEEVKYLMSLVSNVHELNIS